jgi:hypothetical protein
LASFCQNGFDQLIAVRDIVADLVFIESSDPNRVRFGKLNTACGTGPAVSSNWVRSGKKHAASA